MSSWAFEHRTGTAQTLHARDALTPGRRAVSVLEVASPALVLGSTQKPDVVDMAAAAARGVEVARRRTGGGAVYLDPGEQVWIDVTVPAGDPLWEPDTAKAFGWLGHVWVEALGDLGVEGAIPNESAVCHSVLGRLICFAGLGFGEVSTAEGKVVGVSQRRTRAGAWFQCALLHRWDPEPYAALLAPALAAAAEDPAAELAGVGVHEVTAPADDVVAAFVERLPS